MTEVEARHAAEAAHLHYVNDRMPGITRHPAGKAWSYRAPDGKLVRDEASLSRIRALAIPPAYREVWISCDPLGHLQATGRDARGRKQYRYHPKWRHIRDETKYHRMFVFATVLPRIRAQVAADLNLRGLPREKILATIVRLMEQTLIRVGNEQYARQNKSFGLTTLRNRHVTADTANVHFAFRGKSGIKHEIDVRSPQLARIVRRLRDLPGQELFQYLDEDGMRHAVTSADVNEYLRIISGEQITAKDFRTWAATHLAAQALALLEYSDAKTARGVVLRVVEVVARALGNTPAICRKCYIHPVIFEAYSDGSLAEIAVSLKDVNLDENAHELTTIEANLIGFLERRLGLVEIHREFITAVSR